MTDLNKLALVIAAYRDTARERDPHGREHQVADLYFAEARDLAVTPDSERERRLFAWATAAGIATPK